MSRSLTLAAALLLAAGAAQAKLPAPSDEAKAKAAEAAAKTAHAGKVDNFKLCKSMDAVAAAYYTQAKKAGKETKPATATPEENEVRTITRLRSHRSTYTPAKVVSRKLGMSSAVMISAVAMVDPVWEYT